jgi:hypothetical protein
MQNDIRAIKAVADFRLEVELVDGRRGVFDLGPCLHQPALAALRDVAYFVQVSILYGAATWPGGEDISPATLAAGLRTEQLA